MDDNFKKITKNLDSLEAALNLALDALSEISTRDSFEDLMPDRYDVKEDNEWRIARAKYALRKIEKLMEESEVILTDNTMLKFLICKKIDV